MLSRRGQQNIERERERGRRSPYRACRSVFSSFRRGPLAWSGFSSCPVLRMGMFLQPGQSCWGGQFAKNQALSSSRQRDDLQQAEEGVSVLLEGFSEMEKPQCPADTDA